ncbi:MAG: glutamine synthetase family protein [Patescibacteria group bacterium]|nr:glutamine synthetase family protein [Patescibacteria group bacterium]
MRNFNFNTETEVLNLLKKDKEIKFVRIIFPDVLGREMSFTIPSEEMKSAFELGKGFDGSSVEGFARIEESDLIIVPDPKTFRVLPWKYEINELSWREAIVFGDVFTPEGNHFAGDSRYLLKKILEKTKKFGNLFVGPELEFFIFQSENEPKLLDHGGYFYGGKWGEIRKASQLYLKEMGINCEYDHHEVAPSQHEIDLKFNEALFIADSIMIAKYVIKRVARKLGLFVSFMPKPITGLCGNGMHLHLSLWQENKNLFSKNKSLSDLAKKYLIGLIKYGKEIQLILNQCINSYKRLIPGYEAPVYLAWGKRNRSAYIRVPESQIGKESAIRIELRSPDPACNIYLALALIQAAGTQGIKENLKFLPPEEKDIFKMKKSERKKRKIEILSKNLKEALNFFKKSKLVKGTLGNHLFQKIIQNKEIEWQNYKKAVGKKFEKEVSPYEIKKYLPVL